MDPHVGVAFWAKYGRLGEVIERLGKGGARLRSSQARREFRDEGTAPLGRCSGLTPGKAVGTRPPH